MYDEDKMSAASPAYFEIIDFIAAGTTPEAVADSTPRLTRNRELRT
jgi:hypothetical protein